MDALTDALNKAHLDNGVSFAGRALKLNGEEDAEEITRAIDQCANLEFLNLEGNTLGIEAARAIARSLEKHGEFKRALWKDLFTGRMKTEIPIALTHLGDSLVVSKAKLVELDLSDNAFGPIGVQGLVTLLKSPCCFALQELRLNNNGLGITGGKLLAGALMDCYTIAKEKGHPLALRVFIAGRNRLENEGATALANVFKTLGSLEEIQMPQNGIYHVGIGALSESFIANKRLKILNLNDNTIGPIGAKALSAALKTLPEIRHLNFGDCLLKSGGTAALADGIRSCEKLEDLVLSFNEIRLGGSKKLLKSLENKTELKTVNLNGNKFGEDGVNEIIYEFYEMDKPNVLETLEEDEGDDSDDEDETDGSGEGEDEEEEDIIEVNDNTESTECERVVSVEEFLINPSVENFSALGEERYTVLHEAASSKPDSYVETFVQVVMSVTSVSAQGSGAMQEIAVRCADQLLTEIFSWAQSNGQIWNLNNFILINLGLMKSEEKKFKPRWDVKQCVASFRKFAQKNYFPQTTKDALGLFLDK